MSVRESIILESSDDSSSASLVVPATWYTFEDAARVLGISATALRKRVASGELTSIRAGRSRRVLLLGDATGGDIRKSGKAVPGKELAPPTAPPTESPARSEDIEILARTSEALSGLVRDLQRQSLALAGQIGYLQAQLVEAQARVKLLEQSPAAEPVVTHNTDEEQHAHTVAELERVRHEVAGLRDEQRRSQELAAQPRRWRFWRRRNAAPRN